MRTIHIKQAFTWTPPAPAEGKRTPPELRARAFKPHRVESVPDAIAAYAVTNGYAADPDDPKGQHAAKVQTASDADAKKRAAAAKAAADAAAKQAADEAAAKAKADAEAKAKQAQGGQAGGSANPPPAEALKFALAAVDKKTAHVTAQQGTAAPVQLTEAPLPNAAAQQLLSDLQELAPATLEEAKKYTADE